MSSKNNQLKTDRDDSKIYTKKISRKQEVIRPSSIIPPSQGLGRHNRAASVSTTSYILEKSALEKNESNILKNGDSDLRRGRKTRRANSLPTSNTKRYSIETNIRQCRLTENLKKTVQSTRDKRKDVECKRIHRQRMSLDLSQVSDFADSEGESKDKFAKHLSRRRRSAEKTARPDRLPTQLAVRSMSNSPSSKISSCTHQAITRRSSLQNFSPRSYASYENVPQNGAGNFKNQTVKRRTSSAMFIRKASLGSSLMRNSEFMFSSESPDNTSDPSPSDVSPYQKPNSLLPTTSNKLNESKNIFESISNRTVRSTSYQSSGWMENDKSKNESAATPKERGEWNSFWQNYNSSLAALPKRFFYDDCPTPFYEPKINGDIKAFEINYKPPELPREDAKKNGTVKIKTSKENDKKGVFLSNSEAKEIIHCAQRLAELLSCALERETHHKNGKGGGESKKKEVKSEQEDKEKCDNKNVGGDISKDVFL